MCELEVQWEIAVRTQPISTPRRSMYACFGNCHRIFGPEITFSRRIGPACPKGNPGSYNTAPIAH
jgi:hypothetical protein